MCIGGGVGNRYLINLRQNNKYQYNWQVHLTNKHKKELLGESDCSSPLGIVQITPPGIEPVPIVIKKKKEVVLMNNRSKDPP